jgi:DNA invertase Pin-like site-specific DNA recombinase
MGRLFVTLIGSIAELESDLIRERVLAGMRRAKLDGVRMGRAPMNIDRAAIVRDRLSGMTLTAVAKKWGISRSLVCKLVKRSRAGDEGSALPPFSVVDSVHVMQSSSAEARW